MKRLILILTLLASPAYAGEDQECRQMVTDTVGMVLTEHENWKSTEAQIVQLAEMNGQLLIAIKRLEARIKQLEVRR